MPLAVIMAGGQGERFWPLTKEKFPKYQIKLDGKTSLLQKTYQRLLKIYPKKHVFVVTTEDHAFLIKKELPAMGRGNIFIEPCRKNTAAAICFSMLLIQKQFGGNAVVSFFPADHLIQNELLFKNTLRQAIGLAFSKETLVTIGITPSFPATGYGYIKSGKPVKGFKDAYEVNGFFEKPTRTKALAYLRKKVFFWNSGIFTWRVRIFLESMRRYSRDIYETLDINALRKTYRRFPRISIDYALLEKARNISLVKTKMDWCDMGSWDMFYEKGRKDKNKNLIYGKVAQKEVSESLILNYKDNPLAVLGLSGYIVVQSERGSLICKRTRAEEAALLVKKLPPAPGKV